MENAKIKSLLEEYYQLDYPKYDLHFCFQTTSNSTIQFIKQISQKYPHIKTKIHTDPITNKLGNKKILNISKACSQSEGELIWVIDENIHTYPTSLKEMVTLFDNEQVGCVHQIPVYKSNDSFADIVNMTFFSTHHSRFYLVADAVGINCVSGMSMMFDREKLNEIGTIESFSRFLSEDYSLLLAFSNRGYEVKVSPSPAVQDPDGSTISGFTQRMIRWMKLRFNVFPHFTILEPLSQPLLPCIFTSIYLWNVINAPIPFTSVIYMCVLCVFDQIMHHVISYAFPEQGVLPPLGSRIKAWFFSHIFLMPYIYIKSIQNCKYIEWHDTIYNISWGTIIMGNGKETANTKIGKKYLRRYQLFKELQT